MNTIKKVQKYFFPFLFKNTKYYVILVSSLWSFLSKKMCYLNPSSSCSGYNSHERLLHSQTFSCLVILADKLQDTIMHAWVSSIRIFLQCTLLFVWYSLYSDDETSEYATQHAKPKEKRVNRKRWKKARWEFENRVLYNIIFSLIIIKICGVALIRGQDRINDDMVAQT